MNLNPKFFVTAIILSAMAGLTSKISRWLILLYDFPPASIGLLNLAVVGPTGLVMSVVLPFIVMHFMSRNVHPLLKYKSIIFSVFLGCWGGQVTVFFADVLFMSSRGGTYTDSWLVPLWFTWEILVLALSTVFFVCLGGILLAYFQETISKVEATTCEDAQSTGAQTICVCIARVNFEMNRNIRT